MKDNIDEFNEDAFNKSKTKIKTCMICHTKNSYNAQACKKCGIPLTDITCPVCKTLNRFDQKYCTKCDSILQNTRRHR